jgi:hypothetical protein
MPLLSSAFFRLKAEATYRDSFFRLKAEATYSDSSSA